MTMDHVSMGPVSSMPGSRINVPEGTMCDDCDNPAVKRVQGETDSFGCEYIFWCQACVDKCDAYEREERVKAKHCEWCKQLKTDVRLHRDSDEGSCGPLYDVCFDCRKKEADELRAELDRYQAMENLYIYDDDEYVDF